MTALTIAPKSLAPPSEPLWRFSVAQYHRMIEAGVFTSEERVELLDGWLVARMPKDPPHTLATQLVADAIQALIPPGWYLRRQEPITLHASEPEPDLTVVQGNARRYGDRHPGPGETSLVIEIADATLQRDRGWKCRLYAEAGIPVYWILNLPDRRLEVYSRPSGGEYGQVATFEPGQAVAIELEGSPAGLLRVADLLP
jgi:Uma2 family endonuclease